MDEFKELYSEEFFIIDSNKINLVRNKLYGFVILQNRIIEEFEYNLEISSNNGAFILINVDNDTISITQDFLGSYGLYIYKTNNYFAISNSFMKLVEYLKDSVNLSFNKRYADAFLFANVSSYSYDETLVNEIRLIPRYYKIHINKDDKSITYEKIDYHEDTIPIDSEEGIKLLDKWYNKWVNIFRFIKSHTNNLMFDLSGGYDSRALAAIWLTSNLDLNKLYIHSMVDSSLNHKEDYQIALEIAKKFNFELNKNSNKERVYFKDVNTLINIYFYLKFGFHKEIYMGNSRFKDTLFAVNGACGSITRSIYNQMPDEYANDIINNIKKHSEDVVESTEYIVYSSIEKVKEALNIPDENLIELPEKMYNEIRGRHHYGKSTVEAYLLNKLVLSPLMDSELYKLKRKNNSCDDNEIMIALICLRYCPELLNFKFEGKRKINKNTIDYAKKINEKFPFNSKRKPLITGPGIKSIGNNTNIKSYFNSGELNKTFEQTFYSKFFRLEFEKYYSKKIYDEIYNYIKTSNYFPLTHVYSAIAILKVIHDTNFKTINNQNINMWIKSLNHGDIKNELDHTYSNNMLLKLLLKYNTARIDFKNMGTKSNSIEVIESTDNNLSISYPKWFKSLEGNGLCVESSKGQLDLKIKCINDGKLRIWFKAKDVRDKNNNKFPVFIDYINVTINNKIYINKNTLITCFEDKYFDIIVQDNEIINLHIEWLPFTEKSIIVN